MAVVLKTTVRETVPGVRIPLPPPIFAKRSLRSRLRLAGPRRVSEAKSDSPWRERPTCAEFRAQIDKTVAARTSITC
jgi:hypothetical protein